MLTGLLVGIRDDAFEDADVMAKPSSPLGSQPVHGLLSSPLLAFPNLHQAGFAQNGQMTAEIPDCQRAELLQVVEQESAAVCSQRSPDTQVSLIVNHPDEAFVGKPSRLRALTLTGHLRAPKSNTKLPRRKAGRPRNRGPSATESTRWLPRPISSMPLRRQRNTNPP